MFYDRCGNHTTIINPKINTPHFPLIQNSATEVQKPFVEKGLFLTDPTSMVTYVCNCRCSPYIIINKLVESNSWTSDSNAYFPVPPCEYGGPREALAAGDYKAVFVMAEPEKIPRHNFYEGLWFMKTGLPRMVSD